MNKMNTLQHMEELLQKFYDGTSTVNEEYILREFLNSADCPEDWDVHRSVFDALSGLAEVPVPDGLAERIATSIRPRRTPVLLRFLPIGVAVAAVLIFALIFPSLHEQKQPAFYADNSDRSDEVAAVISHVPPQPVVEQPVPQILNEQPIARAKVKAKPEPQPASVLEVKPDSVVKTTLMQQEMEMERQILACAQLEADMLAYMALVDEVVEYGEHLDMEERIEVW